MATNTPFLHDLSPAAGFNQPVDITTLTALADFAKQLENLVLSIEKRPLFIALNGDLGAGKTTFSQQFIHHCGFLGAVTSPTYALMQHYVTPKADIIHADLYRLGDAQELYEIGLLDDAIQNQAIVLIEWFSKGKGVLKKPEIALDFDLKGEKRQVHVYIDPALSI